MRKVVMGKVEAAAVRLASLPKALYLALGVFFGMALGGGTAYAVTTPAANVVKSGFSSLQTDLVTYLGYAAVLVVAIAGIAIGLSMLIHWAKRAAHA